MLARVVYGARVSLTVAFGTALIAAAFGILLGLPAGYFRGRTETLLMGAADIGLAFPAIILILLVAAYAGASVVNLILVLGILGIPIYMRIARAVTLTFAQREFVVAARVLGASHLRIMRRELLPNVALPVAVVAAIGMSRIIVIEGILSFLALGVAPPTPTWGNMIALGAPPSCCRPGSECAKRGPVRAASRLIFGSEFVSQGHCRNHCTQAYRCTKTLLLWPE